MFGQKLKLAIVSFEFVGLSSGGIGTYVYNVAKTMGLRGNEVHVFTGQPGPSERLANVVIHEVPSRRDDFAHRVVPVFEKEHLKAPFDVVESREYRADAFEVFSSFPEIARVVKLATPTFLVSEINNAYLPTSAKMRFVLGGLRRGMLNRPYWWYRDSPSDRERLVSEAADELTSPSRALRDAVAKRWHLDRDRCSVIPHIFPLPDVLRQLPVETTSRRVLFLGKLEPRKGVVDIVDAVPKVVSALPDIRFRFVGRSLPVPGSDYDTQTYLTRRLGRYAKHVEFAGDMKYEDALRTFADSAVCVFPSYWEAFGFVVLEAMSAGRPVIGSSSGGMAEIIEDGRTGVLVPPRSPSVLASQILDLLRDPARRQAMGRAARQHVLDAYSAETIGPVQEASYHRAISLARQRAAKVTQ